MTEKFVLVNLKGKKAKKLAETISNDTCRKILNFLSEKDEVSASEISKKLDIPISTINYNLKSLMQSKLIESKEFKWSPKGREMDLYKIARKFIILSPGRMDDMKDKFKAIIPVILILAAVSFAYMFISPENLTESSLVNKFSSVEELHEFLLSSKAEKEFIWEHFDERNIPRISSGAGTATVSGGSVSAIATDYSSTNIQVEGVDEADFVKNDDKYIYMIKDNKLIIIDAYPAREAKIVSETVLEGNPKNMFVNEDKLVVYTEKSRKTYILIYDISYKRGPNLIRNYDLNGNYFESRMVGDYVYLIVKSPTRFDDETVDVPTLREFVKLGKYPRHGSLTPEVYYFDNPENYYVFNTIFAFDIFNDEINVKTFMVGDSSNLYMSEDNIYLTYKENFLYDIEKYEEESERKKEKTIIHKISVDKGDIKYEASGEVYGHVLNQFSMDEYDNHFRIATTIGQVWDRNIKSTNNIYVLDKNLEIVGELEDLAPGEKIYSARFMGEKGYIVTFKKVDPLFVIDLSNHKNPNVLGKLKIPGYSDYLHPYDENHLIGIGKDTIESESGDFAWYQGIKMALFDVSDVENPIEMDKVVIGKRGSDSEVLRDHKAFLFDREKNILVLPVDELKEVNYYHNQELYTTRREMWRGAYVFRIDPSEGFELRGTISHAENDENDESYWRSSSETIKRSLFMDDVLYTISGIAVKMNNINIITDDINMIEL